ncbi:MAG: ubiE2 [Solimicrobium sp.]|jgi:3' terminal RNA ribose 2'-O-methyltransferase Hen1|nr:ubiE2 [Solimicrobium sp.]
MYLTITTTHQPATDLGYLLHKNPFKTQTFSQSFGKTHVFYTEAQVKRCTAVLLLDIDPIGLVRRVGSGSDFALEQYVNDRPYVASSFLSVALGDVLRSAIAGRSTERQELAETAIPLEATIGVLPSRGGEEFLRRLFEPLGYETKVKKLPLDEQFPEWGESRYFKVTLRKTCLLKDLLTHLYVLIPVLDNGKHYWVGEEEVDKLLRHGEGWLSAHPEKEQITRRYLKHARNLAHNALTRLSENEDEQIDEFIDSGLPKVERERSLEEKLSLNEIRLRQIVEIIEESTAVSVIDLGCGEGKLLSALLKIKQLNAIVGMDVSIRTLEIAKDRLNWDQLPPKQQEKLKLIHGSLLYRDSRLAGFDIATVIEVIEHLDMPRLSAFERVLFEFAKPKTIIMTTPNAEYNVRFENLPPGQFRHTDHRFEWTRAEFEDWACERAAKYGYSVEFRPVGEVDPFVGAPTQLGLFTLVEAKR